MKIIKRVITVLITTILVFILSFNIFNFISINILKNELPTINGYSLLEVVSGSMEPKISIGDMIIIDTKIDNYKVNDIVTFKDVNGNFVTHKIIEIDGDKVITKGDANNAIDEAIDIDSIVGRYIYKIDGIGALFKSLRSPFSLVMILVIGVLLCILVSTDSKGNAILTKEEKEYIEFLEHKNAKVEEDKKILKVASTKKSTSKNSKTTSSKKEVAGTKKSTSKTPKTTSNKKEVASTKKSTSKTSKTTSSKKEVASTKKSTSKTSKTTSSKKEAAGTKKSTSKTPKTTSSKKEAASTKKSTSKTPKTTSSKKEVASTKKKISKNNK